VQQDDAVGCQLRLERVEIELRLPVRVVAVDEHDPDIIETAIRF